MKPDKICIQEGAILRTEKTYDNDVCYVRKDYLLEWANGLREEARKSRANPPSIGFDRYMEGKEATLSKLIDKLNEL